MGRFHEALEEMLKWLNGANNSLDEICATDLNEVKLVDIELARLKVLQNDIRAQEQTVEKLKDTGKNLIRNEASVNKQEDIKERLEQLIINWENVVVKSQKKQKHLNELLTNSQNYQSDVQDALLWLSEIESQLITNRAFGGLPETAKDQLEKFMKLYKQLDANEARVKALISNGQRLNENNLLQNKNLNSLFSLIETLSSRWNHVIKKANDRKERLEGAYVEAVEFHNLLQKFISWLTDTEKILNTLKPVSRVLDTVAGQIAEHQILQKNITEHRDQMLQLDKLGTHIKYFSQKQDVILVKNLLISVQNRWEKIVSRSAERTRDLERGFKDAKQFYDMWQELYTWLLESLDLIGQDIVIGNQPEKIKKQINKHREFHRNVSLKQPMYDIAIKLGKKLIEKCDIEQDRHQLQDMLNDLKNKWQSLCYQSIERQKLLEDSLLCSGQFRDALQALIDWLVKTEEFLDEKKPINGDLDCVLNLIDENKRFQNELQHKMEQVTLVRKAANDIINNSTSVEDSNNLQKQLEIMNDKWDRVTELSFNYATRLEGAVDLAREFHKNIKSRLDWLNSAEQQLKYMPAGLDSEAEICDAIEHHQSFKFDIKDQEELVKQALDIGDEILKACVPDATINVKHCMAVLQQRWEEMLQLCEQKDTRLNEILNTVKENEALLNELLAWVQGAEATLIALDQKQLPNSIEQVETLLQDHQEFQNEMTSRQTNVEKITKNNSIKDDYLYTNGADRKKSMSSKTYVFLFIVSMNSFCKLILFFEDCQRLPIMDGRHQSQK